MYKTCFLPILIIYLIILFNEQKYEITSCHLVKEMKKYISFRSLCIELCTDYRTAVAMTAKKKCQNWRTTHIVSNSVPPTHDNIILAANHNIFFVYLQHREQHISKMAMFDPNRPYTFGRTCIITICGCAIRISTILLHNIIYRQVRFFSSKSRHSWRTGTFPSFFPQFFFFFFNSCCIII